MKSRLRALLPLALLLLATSALGEERRAGTVTGRLACGESCRGVASLWDASGEPPDPRRYIVIPVSVTTLGPDGSFRLSAPPGRYYVGGVVRGGAESRIGPPAPGDRIFMTPDAAGAFKTVEVRAGETVDLGLQEGGWTYEGFAELKGPAVAGTVVSVDGKPLGGLLVFAFANPEMSGTPLAVSERTGRDGSFLLRLPRSGTVYLRVMENYGGGRPADGGYMGVYGGAQPRPLQVEGEETVGDVRIETLRLPSARDPKQMRMKPAGR